MDEITLAVAAKMKVDELKAALRARGLAISGKKQELYDRLANYLKEGQVKQDESPQPLYWIADPEAKDLKTIHENVGGSLNSKGFDEELSSGLDESCVPVKLGADATKNLEIEGAATVSSLDEPSSKSVIAEVSTATELSHVPVASQTNVQCSEELEPPTEVQISIPASLRGETSAEESRPSTTIASLTTSIGESADITAANAIDESDVAVGRGEDQSTEVSLPISIPDGKILAGDEITADATETNVVVDGSIESDGATDDAVAEIVECDSHGSNGGAAVNAYAYADASAVEAIYDSDSDDFNNISVTLVASADNHDDTDAVIDVPDSHNANAVNDVSTDAADHAEEVSIEPVASDEHEDEVSAKDKTFHVRIDNFKRPLQKTFLREFLEGLCGHVIADDNLWLNDFKSHCYIDFATKAQADACVAAVQGRVLDPRQKDAKPLEADFTSVSAKEAAAGAPEARKRPGEWKLPTATFSAIASPKGGLGGPEKGRTILITTTNDKSTGPLSATNASRGVVGLGVDVLKKAVLQATNSTRGSFGGSQRPVGTSSIEGNEIVGFTIRRNRNENDDTKGEPSSKRHRTAVEETSHDSIERGNTSVDVNDARKTLTLSGASKSSSQESEYADEKEDDEGLGLDDLFRKTRSQPSLYWLPVSDDIVAERQKNGGPVKDRKA